MPSPFPGMDPYLESPAHWSDFHPTFILTLREALLRALPEHYFARIEEHVMLVEPESLATKVVRPDVVVGRERQTAGVATATALEITAEPTTLANVESLDPHTEAYIELLHLPDREVVAVLELLSPTNKSGDGRGIYLEKRQRYLRQSVHVVELDLIRGGRRLQLSQALPRGDYFMFASRADRRPDCDVYPWTMRDRLPVVPVPLRSPDPDVRIDLGEVFRTTYERGRYEKMIDYGRPPPPPLTPGDAEWVRSVVGATGVSSPGVTPVRET